MIGTFIQVDGEINDRTKDKKRIMGICCLLIQMNILFMGNIFLFSRFQISSRTKQEAIRRTIPIYTRGTQSRSKEKKNHWWYNNIRILLTFTNTYNGEGYKKVYSHEQRKGRIRRETIKRKGEWNESKWPHTKDNLKLFIVNSAVLRLTSSYQYSKEYIWQKET